MFDRTLSVRSTERDGLSRGVRHDRPDQLEQGLSRESHSGIWPGDLDLVDEYVAANYVGQDPNVPGELHGPAEFREFNAGLQDGMNDIDHTIKDIFGEGNRVAVRGRLTARHTGEAMGIPPTD